MGAGRQAREEGFQTDPRGCQETPKTHRNKKRSERYPGTLSLFSSRIPLPFSSVCMFPVSSSLHIPPFVLFSSVFALFLCLFLLPYLLDNSSRLCCPRIRNVALCACPVDVVHAFWLVLHPPLIDVRIEILYIYADTACLPALGPVALPDLVAHGIVSWAWFPSERTSPNRQGHILLSSREAVP